MISRRAFSAALAAIPVGIACGTLVRQWPDSGATIRFLGERQTIITLLDTGNERALFLLGEPNAGILAHLPQLLTFGNTRVDLIAASHQWLTTEGIRTVLNMDDTPTISLQGNSTLPPIVNTVRPVSDALSIQLGNTTVVNVTVTQQLGDESDDPHVRIEITCQGIRMFLASRETALDNSLAQAHLIAVPGDVSLASIERLSPALFVGTTLHADAEIDEVMVFYNEPVTLSISDSKLTVSQS